AVSALRECIPAPLDLLEGGEQVVHLQAVDLRQGQLLQPGEARLGREALGGHLPWQVVASQEVPDLVDQARPGLASLLAQRGQPAVLLIGAAGDVALAEPADRLALQQAFAVDPEQLAERGRVPAIGLALLALVGLDQDHLVAVVLPQHANEPVVEATDLEHSHEGLPVVQALAGEPLEESVDLVRLRRDLAGLQDIAAFIAEGDRDLPCVLVDAQVQHGWFSGGAVGLKISYSTLPTRGRTDSSQRGHSFIDTTARYGF